MWGNTDSEDASKGSAIEWLRNQEVSVKLAMKSGRMLLVYIEDVDSDSSRQGPASPIDPWIEWIEEEGEDFEKIRRS